MTFESDSSLGFVSPTCYDILYSLHIFPIPIHKPITCLADVKTQDTSCQYF